MTRRLPEDVITLIYQFRASICTNEINEQIQKLNRNDLEPELLRSVPSKSGNHWTLVNVKPVRYYTLLHWKFYCGTCGSILKEQKRFIYFACPKGCVSYAGCSEYFRTECPVHRRLVIIKKHIKHWFTRSRKNKHKTFYFAS